MTAGGITGTERVTSRRSDDGRTEVVSVDARSTDGAPGDVTDLVIEAVSALGATLSTILYTDERNRPIRILVAVATNPSPIDPVEAACAEAARGLVQGLAVEFGLQARLNFALADHFGVELDETVAFLGAADADFVTGSTFDLRGAP